MVEPWIGRAYSKDRVLLLGESAYTEEDEVGELKPLKSSHLTDLVRRAISEFPGLRFFNMLTRGLAGQESPSQQERQDAWDRVAFVNYVPETVGGGPRVRPNAELWQLAREGFRPLLEQHKPQTVIVLGKVMWSGYMPDADLWITDDVQGYQLTDGTTTMFWSIPHPSAGLSWKRLTQVIAFAAHRTFVWPV